jgi:hypothetical protein
MSCANMFVDPVGMYGNSQCLIIEFSRLFLCSRHGHYARYDLDPTGHKHGQDQRPSLSLVRTPACYMFRAFT